MKKVFTLACLAIFVITALVMAGCGSGSNGNKKVAVAFANSSASWQKNGQTIKDTLEKEGFTVTTYIHGLGENEAVRQMFVERADEAWNALEAQ